jgi:hypothetical protein
LHREKLVLSQIHVQLAAVLAATLSTSEVHWSHLLQILCKLQGESGVTNPLKELNAIRQSQLINEDPVTCVIYFNKLVDVIMRVLQLRKISPCGEHRIVDYFKR